MTKRTCAACDVELDDNAIQVKIRGKTVEVCCKDCATKLKEADDFAEPGASDGLARRNFLVGGGHRGCRWARADGVGNGEG